MAIERVGYDIYDWTAHSPQKFQGRSILPLGDLGGIAGQCVTY